MANGELVFGVERNGGMAFGTPHIIIKNADLNDHNIGTPCQPLDGKHLPSQLLWFLIHHALFPIEDGHFAMLYFVDGPHQLPTTKINSMCSKLFASLWLHFTNNVPSRIDTNTICCAATKTKLKIHSNIVIGQ